jgi:hypothetical protein
MKLKAQDRERIERCLEQLGAWRGSGQSLKQYCDARGHRYAQWRAWLSFEAQWRQALNGGTSTRVAATRFVQAHPPQEMGEPRAPASVPGAGLRITLQSPSGSLVARIDWPLERAGAPSTLSASAAWLREVLA